MVQRVWLLCIETANIDEFFPMRSFYSTFGHLRIFVLGVPEYWQIAYYDLTTQKWLDLGGSFDGALKDAKSEAVNRAAALIGKKLPDLKWH